MPRYTKLPRETGESYLRHVRNLEFKTQEDADYFVEPWKHVARRDCSVFRRILQEDTLELELVFATDEADLIEMFVHRPTEPYLYGAYNQIVVCQMRALGWVLPMEEPAIEAARQLLLSKLTGHARNDPLKEPLDRIVLEQRIAMVRTGRIFTFVPHSYAYATYERG